MEQKKKKENYSLLQSQFSQSFGSLIEKRNIKIIYNNKKCKAVKSTFFCFYIIHCQKRLKKKEIEKCFWFNFHLVNHQKKYQ